MLWIKTFHILFVMAWMAGLFYLPRIFVHYVEGMRDQQDVQRLIIMATKLWGFSSLMAIIALSLGMWLWLAYGFSGTWLWVKLAFVALLIAYHFACKVYLKKMQNGELIQSSLYFRIFNEGTLLIVIPILIMVVVKPF